MPVLRLGRLRHQPRRRRRAPIAESCVRQPSYLAHLSTVLDEVPIEDWKQWMLFHVLRSAAPYLTDDFVETNFDFYGRTLNGTPELRARWKRGVALVEGAHRRGRRQGVRRPPLPAGVQGADGRAGRQPARGLPPVDRRAGLDERGDQAAGLREARHVPAQDRLPREVPRLLRARRSAPTTCSATSPPRRRSRPTASCARSARRSTATSGSCCRRPSTPTTTPAPTRSASRPGILQKPFFSPDADAAENYGGIGAVIGHEIGHGFDDQGAQYDGAGNLNDWWTADDKAAFEVKSKALIEQYDAFEPRSLPGEHVNGALTVGENIGDLGGLTIGHKAYVISRGGAGRRGLAAPAVHELGLLLADQAPQGAGAAVPHHRPAQPAGVPRQHRAQPRRVPRGVRDRPRATGSGWTRTSGSGSGERGRGA